MSAKFQLTFHQVREIQDGASQAISDGFRYGDIDREGDWRSAVADVTAEYYASAYQALLDEMQEQLDDLERRVRQTEGEWRIQYHERERERERAVRQADAEKTRSRPARKGKQVNVVKFDVRATFERPADDVLADLFGRYAESEGKTFQVTHGQADGNDLWLWITYGPLKGGEKSDVKRVLDTCAERTENPLATPAVITVLERTPVEPAA